MQILGYWKDGSLCLQEAVFASFCMLLLLAL